MTRSTLLFAQGCLLSVLLAHGHAERGCAPPPSSQAASHTTEDYGALGDWFAAQHQPQCAVDAFHRGLQDSPRSAPLHYSLGMVLLSEGQRSAAAAEMQKTVSLDPHFDRAFLVLGIIAHDRGDRDGALQQWQRAAQLNPDSVTALDWIAKTRIEAGQYTEAMDLLAGTQGSEDLTVDYLVAASKASLTEKGISTAEQALAAHPGWNRLRTALATVLVQRNRFEDSLKLLRSAREAEPGSVELQTLTLRVLLLMGDTDAAQPYADGLLAAEPGTFDALYLNGLLKRQSGDFAEALPLLKRAVALQPNHFDARFNLGIVYAKLHHLAEAKQELLRASTLPDATAEVHFQLASALRSSGDASAADAEMKVYQQQLAARVEHDELVSLSAQASQKLQAGDAQGAADIERSILGKSPEQAVHWYDLALALDKLNDLAGEITALQHAVQLRPDLAIAWNQLGYLCARSGDPGQAEAAFRAAIAAAPQYAEAQNNLGSLLAEAGRDGDAEPYFRAALTANPRLFDAWINLAAILATGGRYDEARAAAKRAETLQPGNPEARRLLQMLADSPTPGPAVP